MANPVLSVLKNAHDQGGNVRYYGQLWDVVHHGPSEDPGGVTHLFVLQHKNPGENLDQVFLTIQIRQNRGE